MTIIGPTTRISTTTTLPLLYAVVIDGVGNSDNATLQIEARRVR